MQFWEGSDHLLFMLGLLLDAPNIKTRSKVNTGFTIAHWITLIPSAIQTVSIPASFVEPTVAATLIFVGVENIASKKHDKRFWVAAGFGLVYGFAFAGNVRAARLQ